MTTRVVQRRHLFQGPHDPNSLLHGGFEYLEKSGDGIEVPLVPDDRGRRHLTVPSSSTEAFRPCRRVLTPGFSGASYARPQGLKRVEPTARTSPRSTGLRTNPLAAGRSGYDIPDPGLVLQSKHVVMDDTGRLARDRVSGELTLEQAFGVKRKFNTQRQRRGGIPAKGNPGDKLFHHVDYSPGFHERGELTVGSSFCRTKARKGTRLPHGAPIPDAIVPASIGYALGHRRPRMGFHEAREASQYIEDLRGVLELTEVRPLEQSTSHEERAASWEEKTGMYTWPKKSRDGPLMEHAEHVPVGRQ